MLDTHGAGNGIYSFRNLNQDAHTIEGPTSRREVVGGGGLSGFFDKFKMEPIGEKVDPMAEMLDNLREDIEEKGASQEAIDQWLAEDPERLERLGEKAGFEAESLNLRNGNLVLRGAGGRSRTLSLLDKTA
ncbi:hypothetical protein [Desulfohalovibrio reitneri]|uniref:hypothetical protein n=1 Tax=Desulfohalovibrio reitneri TaxID=1307759 RepID=UPI0004A6C08C|nr:hypothetical protein [Desulfohalovibrio reitneri]